MEQKSRRPARGDGSDVPLPSGPKEPTKTTPKSQREKPRYRWNGRTRPSGTLVRRSDRREILKQEPDCRICGAPATEIDHVHPICRGGPHEPSNWQPLCRGCHLKKTGREGAWCRWRRSGGDR